MNLVQTIVDGVILGGLYALVAQGVALTFGVMRLVNLAHGEFVVLGAYFGWAVHEYLGIGIVGAIPLGVAAGYLGGWLVARAVVLRVVERPQLMGLLLTFGMAFAIQGALVMAFSTTPRITPAFYDSMVWRPFGLDISVSQFTMLAFAVVLLVALAGYLHRTTAGRAMKAAAQNREAARIVGIDIDTMYTRAFAIGAALAVTAGVLFSVTQSFTPASGVSFTLKAFVIVVVGGIGSISGTMGAAMVIGLIESFLAAYVPNIGTGLGVAAAFVLVVVVLAVRPQGVGTPAGARA